MPSTALHISLAFKQAKVHHFPRRHLGHPESREKMTGVLIHPLPYKWEKLTCTTSYSSLELKLWMKLCLNSHAGYKLECLRQGHKPVLMETVAAESISNHLPVPRSRSASIHCSNAVFSSTVGKLVFNKFFMLFSLSNEVVSHFQTIAVSFEQ